MFAEKQNAYRETECLPRNRMLIEKQNAYRNTECLPGNEKHTHRKTAYLQETGTLTEMQNKKLPDYLFASFDARGRRG